MFELKPLTADAIPAALEKAMHYRLLNEPGAAESICHDVLRIDSDNQKALVILLLALTDRFTKGYAVGVIKAEEILPRLKDHYERAYYAGIICERRAKAQLNQGSLGSNSNAYEFLRKAMDLYREAEKIRPAGNDDPILRWNACARMIMQNKLSPRMDDGGEHQLE